MSGIVDWLHSLFSSAIDLPAAVAHYVERALTVIWHTLTDVFTTVHNGWDDMLHGARVIADLIYDSAHAVYVYGRWIVRKVIPDILAWVSRWVDKLQKAIEAGLRKVREWAADLIDALRQVVAGIIPWVLDHVWTPLHNALHEAQQWISDKGAYVYMLVTHPDRLALLLLAPLWGAFLAVLKGSEAKIARWLVAGFYTALLDTAHIAEDILYRVI